MSFSINFSGHIEPGDPAKDMAIRKLARAFADSLRAAGIECSGNVYTPTNLGGNSLDLPDSGFLVVEGTSLHTGHIHTASTTPTGHKPK